MRKYQIKGRFYLFLLAILAIVFLVFVRPRLSLGSKVEVLSTASSAVIQTMDCVIVRDEQLISSTGLARVEYVAAEDTLVSAGDTVAYLYSTGYSETELSKLETVRENIQAYHKTKLNNIIDNNLERLELYVKQRALEFKNLVTHQNGGNLLTVTRLLETAMVNRQEYMRSNMRNDMKLNNLYQQESTRLNSISSWRVKSTAASSGVVSFYTDGYERYLNAGTASTLTASDIQTVLAGGELGAPSVREKDVYRLVNQNQWYTAIIASTEVWNPVIDQPYTLQFEGFDDLIFDAKVRSVSQNGGNVVAVFEIHSPIGPMIYQRTGKVRVSANFTGISVSVKAISKENGQTGVWLYDVPGGTFVPVTVVSTDGKTALIQPVGDEVLYTGQQVLIK